MPDFLFKDVIVFDCTYIYIPHSPYSFVYTEKLSLVFLLFMVNIVLNFHLNMSLRPCETVYKPNDRSWVPVKITERENRVLKFVL